jgi:DNA/RNA endonuclease YhcR with UshA esterase domain
MKVFAFLLGLLGLGFALAAAAAPALAQTQMPAIAAADAKAHVGQTVTVEGVVSEVHTAASGRATFIDIGGRYPNNTFTAVIFSRDVTKFSNVDALNGKTVDVTGPVRLHNGRPEIILNDPGQIKAK